MTKLEIVKSLIALERMESLGSQINLPGCFSEYVKTSKEILSGATGIHLDDKKSTKPTKLYGKTYSSLSREEYNEYIQIKRILLKRKKDNGKK